MTRVFLNSSFGGYLPGPSAPAFLFVNPVDALHQSFYTATQHPLDVSPPNSSFGGYLPGLPAPASLLRRSKVLLIPLAVTSTNAMMRRLGRNWQRLHRLVYPIAILGVLHFLWLVKADAREPLIYAAILALLLGYRVWHHYRRRVQLRGVSQSA